jgi:hypothetical protein
VPGAWSVSSWQRTRRWLMQERIAPCCRNVEGKLPFLKAERVPTASLRRIATASERSTTRAAASRARTPARASRQT